MRLVKSVMWKVICAEKESEPYYLNIQIKGTTKELKDAQVNIASLVNR